MRLLEHWRAARHARGLSERRRRDRWVAIAADIAAAESGYVFLAGDSHAELLGMQWHGCAVVNGGIGGITTGDYVRGFARLTVPPRASTAILIIGSNDTSIASKPLSHRRRGAFAANATGLVRRLRACSDRVVVTALPPVRKPVADRRHLPAMIVYSQILAAICEDCDAIFVDPFAASRGADPALASHEVAMDELGAHFVDYGTCAAALRRGEASTIGDPGLG